MRNWQAQLRAARSRGGWTPPANLAAWWRADANVAAGENWIDKVAGYTLTVPTGCSVTSGTGLVVPAGSAVNINTSRTIPAGGAGIGNTLCLWYRNVTAPSALVYLCSGIGTGSVGALLVNGSRVAYGQSYGGSSKAGPTITDGVWTHLAIAQYWGDDDPGQANKGATLYVNGSDQGNPIVGTAKLARVLRLCGANASWAMECDGVMEFARRLTTAEVADVYNNSPSTHK